MAANPTVVTANAVSINSSGASSGSVNITLTGNVNRRLFLFNGSKDNTDPNDNGVSTIVFDAAGVNLSLANGKVKRIGTDQLAIESPYSSVGEMFEILEADLPGSGTYQIDVSTTGSCQRFMWCFVEVYDVDQGALDATAEGSETANVSGGTQHSDSITTVGDNATVLAFWGLSLSGSSTTSITTTQNEIIDISGSNGALYCSWVEKATAGAQAMDFTSTTSVSRHCSKLVSVVAPTASGAALEGATSISVLAAAALTTGINLAAAVSITDTVGADLTTGINLESATTISVQAGADLSTGIQLSADTSISDFVSADLTTGIQLFADASESFTVTADLTAGGRAAALEGATSITNTTVADLTTGIPLNGDTSLTIFSGADLTTQIQMAAAASETIQATADLTTGISLDGATSVTFQTAASLEAPINFVGDVSITVQTTADLTTGIELASGTVVSVDSAADLTTAINLAGGTNITFQTTALLTVGEVVVPESQTYAIEAENRTYAIAEDDRTYAIESENRTYPVT